jgi:hypothetical protein
MGDKYGPDRPWEASPCYRGLIALITQEELSMTTPSDAFF